MKARYKPLAHEAKMPEARFSKAPAILNREFQLDIWNKLSVHTGRIIKLRMTEGNAGYGLLAQLVEPTGQVIKLPVHEYLK